MSTVVDYAWSRPSIAALKASGATGVSRYLSRVTPSTAGKIITAQEYQQLLAAGLAVVLNWEYAADDYRGGALAGANHAREAIAQATALGYPRGCAIIGSADRDVSRAEWLAPGRPYYQAFSTGLRIAGYRPGIYGPWDVLEWAREDGVADVFWQAGMSWAWSQGRNGYLWPGAHLYQRRQQTIGGADCDVSDIIQADYGQHRAGVTDVELTDRVPSAATPDVPTRNVDQVLGDIWHGVHLSMYARFDQVQAALKTALAEIQADPVTLTDEQVAALGTLIGGAVAGPVTELTAAVRELTNRIEAAGRELQGT